MKKYISDKKSKEISWSLKTCSIYCTANWIIYYFYSNYFSSICDGNGFSILCPKNSITIEIEQFFLSILLRKYYSYWKEEEEDEKDEIGRRGHEDSKREAAGSFMWGLPRSPSIMPPNVYSGLHPIATNSI